MQHINVLTDHGSVAAWVIEAFENDIGYCLPKEYKKLISQHNALHPIQSSFNFINYLGEIEEGGIGFCGYGDWPVPELIQNAQDYSVYGYENIVTFGHRGNGDHICFDYRHDPETCEPKVVLMYHDLYANDTNGNPKMIVNHVADSFEAFVDMLYEYKEESA